jgi:hypothetical protein
MVWLRLSANFGLIRNRSGASWIWRAQSAVGAKGLEGSAVIFLIPNWVKSNSIRKTLKSR